jgi:hypothetical protein
LSLWNIHWCYWLLLWSINSILHCGIFIF